MKNLFATIILFVVCSCSADADAPLPKIVQHEFKQRAVIYYADRSPRVIERTLSCELREARYLGGDWRYFWHSKSDWKTVAPDYSVIYDVDHEWFSHGAVVLHENSSGDRLVMFLGSCTEFMGFGGTSVGEITALVILYNADGFGSDDQAFWGEFSIENIDYKSDPRVVNEIIE